MATQQDDLDRLLIAWQRLQGTVNNKLPSSVDQMYAIRNRVTGVKPPAPKPV